MARTKAFDQHYDSAREQLAGRRAAEAWQHELSAEHLLKLEAPIKDRPVEAENGSKQ